MRREIVRQPCHDERTAREDAACDEECARVLNSLCRCGDEHNVADDGDAAAEEHENPALLCAVGKVAGEKDGEEAGHVGWDL